MSPIFYDNCYWDFEKRSTLSLYTADKLHRYYVFLATGFAYLLAE
jgi:hypothetical protein